MEAEANDLVFYLILLLLVFFISVAYLFVYSGLFSPIEIRTQRPPFGSLHVAYKFARGAYKNAGHLFTEAHSLIPELKTIGVYYDDPQQVNTADLRYCVGVILSEGDATTDESHLKAYLDHGFKEIKFPSVDHSVLTQFPFSNTLSIFIGVARVYPKLAEYIHESKLCAHPMIEIYDNNNIIFMAPLSRQDEFYVEETQEIDGNSSANEESENQGTDSEPVEEIAQTPTSAEDDDQSEKPEMNGLLEENDDSSASSFEELQH